MENFIQQQLYIDDNNNMIYKEPEPPYVVFYDGPVNFTFPIHRDIIMRMDEQFGNNYLNVSITGAHGRKQALKMAEKAKLESISEGKRLVIFTNLTDFLNSAIFNTWNEETKCFQVLFLTKEYELMWADLCTDKELRAGHNLEAIYRNGGFNLDECD